jgi:hypothetical protein
MNRRPSPSEPLAQIALRVPADLLHRADALAPRLNRLPEHAARGAVKRSDVLRLALVRGLDVLEHELRAR